MKRIEIIEEIYENIQYFIDFFSQISRESRAFICESRAISRKISEISRTILCAICESFPRNSRMSVQWTKLVIVGRIVVRIAIYFKLLTFQ